MIVVLVILAILAAIMVPQLVGYIDKAKERNYQVRASAILTAAQSVLDEEYAYAPAKKGKDGGFGASEYIHGSKTETVYNAILKLAEEKDSAGADINKDDPAEITSIDTESNSYKIKKLVIAFGTSKENTMTYSGGKWLGLNETEAGAAG